MAVLVRCFRPPPAPSSGEVSRRFHTPGEVSRQFFTLARTLVGRDHVDYKLSFHHFRKQKVAMFCIGDPEKSHVFSSVNLVRSVGYISQMDKSAEDYAYWKLSGLWNVIIGYISDHQRMTSLRFLKASTLANILVLILPLEALAETCEADNSLFQMPLLFIIALIGATVGGLLARQRKGELKRLNDQLRQINAALRRQAKIESYAPNLSYAPVGRMAEAEVIVDPRKHQLITNLRTGKNYLRNQDPEKAFPEFRAALELAQALGDHVEEKKAARGLGASLQRQGKYREAIKYHSKVLEVCREAGEDSGITEAYGAIADCYTELGDLEQAGKYYDDYIARLRTDMEEE